MARYSGQGSVEVDGGLDVQVMVALRSVRRDGVVSWSGTARVVYENDVERLNEVTRGRLRTVAGESAPFVVAGREAGVIEVAGEDANPPF